jgi:hypothetical protein
MHTLHDYLEGQVEQQNDRQGHGTGYCVGSGSILVNVFTSKAECSISKKMASGKRIKPDDSNVVVSVIERSERDLVRRFNEVNVD